jgi:hypothetical protein
MSEETQEEQVTEESAEVVDQVTEEVVTENPEWLQGKYVTEGKTQEESITEQAKAYNELSGKFGAFTGAPDEYTDVVLSDELKELGIEISSDDPILQAAKEFAKDSNMSQDGLNGMVELYAMQQVAQQTADNEFKAEQMKELGTNADSRIQNIQQWAGKNLDTETLAGLEGFATNAGAVKAIEQLIKMTGNTSVDADETTANQGANAEEVQKMQFELDSNGNRRLQTDPEFRAKFNKMKNEVYGTNEHRVMVGG